MIERFHIPGAPKPAGPYSHAVRAGDFIYVSGQGATNTATGEMELGDIRHETRLVISNIQKILEGAGASLADVVKCSVFLQDVGEFSAMNEVYTEFFGAAKPARTTVQAVMPNPAMHVEIDCVAYKPL